MLFAYTPIYRQFSVRNNKKKESRARLRLIKFANHFLIIYLGPLCSRALTDKLLKSICPQLKSSLAKRGLSPNKFNKREKKELPFSLRAWLVWGPWKLFPKAGCQGIREHSRIFLNMFRAIHQNIRKFSILGPVPILAWIFVPYICIYWKILSTCCIMFANAFKYDSAHSERRKKNYHRCSSAETRIFTFRGIYASIELVVYWYIFRGIVHYQ